MILENLETGVLVEPGEADSIKMLIEDDDLRSKIVEMLSLDPCCVIWASREPFDCFMLD